MALDLHQLPGCDQGLWAHPDAKDHTKNVTGQVAEFPQFILLLHMQVLVPQPSLHGMLVMLRDLAYLCFYLGKIIITTEELYECNLEQYLRAVKIKRRNNKRELNQM